MDAPSATSTETPQAWMRRQVLYSSRYSFIVGSCLVID